METKTYLMKTKKELFFYAQLRISLNKTGIKTEIKSPIFHSNSSGNFWFLDAFANNSLNT